MSDPTGTLQVTALGEVPEVQAGDDLLSLLVAAATATIGAVLDNDIVVVSSKVVSKAEGRAVRDRSRFRRLSRAADQDDRAVGRGG